MKFLKTGVMVFAMVMVGCSSTGGTKEEGASAAGRGPGGGAGGPEISKYGESSSDMYGTSSKYGAGGGAYGAGGGQSGEGALDDPSSPLSKRVIYFMYDSSEVQPEYLSVVNSHANYLASNSGRSVVLEGHADERGSPEYNIALGEQRAKAIAKMMKLQGVLESQIQVVSFGEEKPAVSGHDESSWQQNRRVEISYPRR
ncbi:MAG: peptidoglycan-associated lipoprotein Pal [Methylococcaceae bacterium]|nr:peptidoglycan-associated lipoprotein Pal [Methylococcaceae bacterium]